MTKKANSSNVHIDNSKIKGNNVMIAGRDVIHSKSESNIAPQDLINLITEIQSTLKNIELDPDEKQGAEASLAIAKTQAKKGKPDSTTIVSSLTTALSLITQAGGAAKAIDTVLPLIQKAITFAQHLF